MSKRKLISISELDKEIAQGLQLYCEEVTDQINEAGLQAVEDLVDITKKTAPKKTGKFRRAIAQKTVYRPTGNVHVWYVKAPFHRLTHLLVHGYQKKKGGRVPGDPFLHDALDQVLPQYQRNVEEALKK